MKYRIFPDCLSKKVIPSFWTTQLVFQWPLGWEIYNLYHRMVFNWPTVIHTLTRAVPTLVRRHECSRTLNNHTVLYTSFFLSFIHCYLIVQKLFKNLEWPKSELYFSRCGNEATNGINLYNRLVEKQKFTPIFGHAYMRLLKINNPSVFFSKCFRKNTRIFLLLFLFFRLLCSFKNALLFSWEMLCLKLAMWKMRIFFNSPMP